MNHRSITYGAEAGFIIIVAPPLLPVRLQDKVGLTKEEKGREKKASVNLSGVSSVIVLCSPLSRGFLLPSLLQ